MWRALLIAGLVLGISVPALAQTKHPGAPATMPTVVELFTSQGCDSCPPADAFLTKLAHQPGVIALTYDVDYWNYLGWKDTFATAATTARQQAYAERISNGELYTPEMVIGGMVGVTASDQSVVERLIARAAKSQMAGGIALKVTRNASGVVRIGVPAAVKPTAETAVVWLIGYDSRRVVRVMRGENKGRTITYTNVVRRIHPIGHWSGEAEFITLSPVDLKGSDRALVLVQIAGAGRIIGCAKLPPEKAM
jgi:hypothetical protein